VSFAELVAWISKIDLEMRIRFTSPHPKDFPDELLFIIRDNPNVCKSIHIPAQSGSSNTLSRMRRGYTREAYVRLIQRIQQIIPDVTLSGDFISGFCGETEEDHQETLSLLEEIKFDFAYMFAYSMREKNPSSQKIFGRYPRRSQKKTFARSNRFFSSHHFQKKIHKKLASDT